MLSIVFSGLLLHKPNFRVYAESGRRILCPNIGIPGTFQTAVRSKQRHCENLWATQYKRASQSSHVADTRRIGLKNTETRDRQPDESLNKKTKTKRNETEMKWNISFYAHNNDTNFRGWDRGKNVIKYLIMWAIHRLLSKMCEVYELPNGGHCKQTKDPNEGTSGVVSSVRLIKKTSIPSLFGNNNPKGGRTRSTQNSLTKWSNKTL